jgi:hypothetical protein
MQSVNELMILVSPYYNKTLSEIINLILNFELHVWENAHCTSCLPKSQDSSSEIINFNKTQNKMYTNITSD